MSSDLALTREREFYDGIFFMKEVKIIYFCSIQIPKFSSVKINQEPLNTLVKKELAVGVPTTEEIKDQSIGFNRAYRYTQ